MRERLILFMTDPATDGNRDRAPQAGHRTIQI